MINKLPEKIQYGGKLSYEVATRLTDTNRAVNYLLDRIGELKNGNETITNIFLNMTTIITQQLEYRRLRNYVLNTELTGFLVLVVVCLALWIYTDSQPRLNSVARALIHEEKPLRIENGLQTDTARAVYCVQVASLADSVTLNDVRFSSLASGTKVNIVRRYGRFKYRVGRFYTRAAADQARDELKAVGYLDAFVTQF